MKKLLAGSILVATALFALNGCIGEPTNGEDLQANAIKVKSFEVENNIADLENYEEIASSKFSFSCSDKISLEKIFKKTLFNSDKYSVFLYKTSNLENLNTEEFVSRFKNCIKDKNIQPYQAGNGYLLWSESTCDNANKPMKNQTGYNDWRNCKTSVKQLVNF